MAFYDDMQDMVRDLLKPDTQGGLGQGAITIVRTTPATPDPNEPWKPVVPTEITESVDQVSTKNAEYVDRGTIIKTDYAFTVVPAKKFTVSPGDSVRIGGIAIGTIMHVESLGSHDVPVYAILYVNR